ncbi:MAG: hypothetical protein AB1414_10440, partial [bacterium]
MAISLIKEEQSHILRVLPVLLKKDTQFKDSLYMVLSETFIKKDDFSELKDIVKHLGVIVSELAEAQKRTEMELKALTKSHQALSKSHENLATQVGGISHTIGFRLEDEAYDSLPPLLERDFGIIV